MIQLSSLLTTYNSIENICVHCGKRGGEHFTEEGTSWCYDYFTRRIYNDPQFHKYFAHIEGNTLKENNPNKTFKRGTI